MSAAKATLRVGDVELPYSDFEIRFVNQNPLAVCSPEGVTPISLRDAVSVDVSLTFDGEDYTEFAPHVMQLTQHFDLSIELDHNPWRRPVSSPEQWTRRFREGLWWSFRRRILKRDLAETTTVRIPGANIWPEAPRQ